MEKNKTQSQIRAKLRWGVLSIVVLILICIAFVAPASVNKAINGFNAATAIGLPTIPDKPFQLGLDLQGGAHLTYEADVTEFSDEERGSAVEGARDVIERRVNAFGVGESNVQTSRIGEDFRIIVELPGVTDVTAAIKEIGDTPILEFKEENNIPPRELTPEEQVALDEYNADAQTRGEEILQRIQGGEDFETLAKELSEDSHTQNNGGYIGYLGQHTVVSEIYDWAANAQPGDVSTELLPTPDGLNILRRGEERTGDRQVAASHILVCYLGAQGCTHPEFTKDEAAARAQELFDQATAENFGDLAREHSTDPTVEENGGDLGSFGRGQMTKTFEDAVFNAQLGEIIGPVETEFGYHVIYKYDEGPTVEYELWRLLIQTRSAADILPPQDQWMATPLTGRQLERSEVVTDPNTGAIQVSLQFDSEGADLFAEITERNVGKPVAIFLDGGPISIPTVQNPITNGQAVITGVGTITEARLLTQRLNAGALPVPVELVSQQTVGASLGAESLTTGVKAGIVGVIVVMIFMLIYYRAPGVLAVIALALYIGLTLSLFKLIGVTLTLAGIAGFILSIGMAVDANVLIFERVKEELRNDKSLKGSIEEGFKRAWTSIRDGNVSTLITCAVLIWFGSSFVQGFAVTLFIGILVSMFSAITVTRVLLRFITPWFAQKPYPAFLGAKKEHNA